MSLTTKAEREAGMIGIDAERRIKGAQRELADYIRETDRIRDLKVDQAPAEERLFMGVIVWELPNGVWKATTVSEVFPGQGDQLVVVQRRENHLIAELRWALAQRMVENRYCKIDRARHLAANASVLIADRVLLKDSGKVRGDFGGEV